MNSKGITTLVIFLLFSIVALAQPVGYGYGKYISFQDSLVEGGVDFTDFTILVSLVDDDLRTVANGGHVESANGYDILFTLGDCATQLDHQIERYNPLTGEFIVWVTLPVLYAAQLTNIHMYYGNSGVVADPSTTDVWGPNYAAVWHMNQSPDLAAPQLIDYTANVNDGIANGGMDAADLVAGKIGYAIDFDGSNDFFDCDDLPSTDPIESITFSAWINSDASNGHIINKGGGWSDDGYSMFHLSNQIRIELQRSGEKDIVDNSAPSNGEWHLITVVYNYDTGLIQCYIDGVVSGTTGLHTGPMGNPAEHLNIGRKQKNAYYFNGRIDEGRVIHEYRTGDWILTEYNNQNNPSDFYAITAEFLAGTLCDLLPIELLHFNAFLFDENKVQVDWTTASEINNDFFTIERSLDTENWEEIAIIDGAGNSTRKIDYQYLDQLDLRGIFYYRLKQTDFDGSYSYSGIETIDYRLNSSDSKLTVYPNPSKNTIVVTGYNGVYFGGHVYNTLGQEVTGRVSLMTSEPSKLMLNVAALSPGFYILEIGEKRCKFQKL
ncbi:DUF2341 domain-containing protein [Crocinitomix catalasitica]|uniref:DUF2341 domain-containing protein n=1 Tax=Crocinitomix catalasitica TaxID=184607 RepID=UPI000686C0D5|nr:DUF2341 domain-containing protein [Crocinitomix catalasitica]